MRSGSLGPTLRWPMKGGQEHEPVGQKQLALDVLQKWLNTVQTEVENQRHSGADETRQLGGKLARHRNERQPCGGHRVSHLELGQHVDERHPPESFEHALRPIGCCGGGEARARARVCVGVGGSDLKSGGRAGRGRQGIPSRLRSSSSVAAPEPRPRTRLSGRSAAGCPARSPGS